MRCDSCNSMSHNTAVTLWHCNLDLWCTPHDVGCLALLSGQALIALSGPCKPRQLPAVWSSNSCLQGSGLSEAQIKLCDKFVYIPQHGEGTASLNVTVAASIVLHHFAIWAGYKERSRQGAKYDVAPPPPRLAPRGTYCSIGLDLSTASSAAGVCRPQALLQPISTLFNR